MNKSEILKERIARCLSRMGEEDVVFLSQIKVLTERYVRERDEESENER